LLRPPLAAIALWPDPGTSLPDATLLLDSSGRECWRGEGAVLLDPAAGSSLRDQALLLRPGSPPDAGSGQDLLFPFGDSLELVAVDAASGTEQWHTPLPVAFSVADAELLALDEHHGLLVVSYGYVNYEFFCFDRRDGQLNAPGTKLFGQVAYTYSWPGGIGLAGYTTVTDGVAEVGIFTIRSEPQLWRFTLATGELEVASYDPPAAMAEDNPLPTEGHGAPGPGAAPFPPSILPGAYGESWSITPLVNDAGQALVVISGNTRWVDRFSCLQSPATGAQSAVQ
jgi:outer membrane protein assembly factor BamB